MSPLPLTHTSGPDLAQGSEIKLLAPQSFCSSSDGAGGDLLSDQKGKVKGEKREPHAYLWALFTADAQGMMTVYG